MTEEKVTLGVDGQTYEMSKAEALEILEEDKRQENGEKKKGFIRRTLGVAIPLVAGSIKFLLTTRSEMRDSGPVQPDFYAGKYNYLKRPDNEVRSKKENLILPKLPNASEFMKRNPVMEKRMRLLPIRKPMEEGKHGRKTSSSIESFKGIKNRTKGV